METNGRDFGLWVAFFTMCACTFLLMVSIAGQNVSAIGPPILHSVAIKWRVTATAAVILMMIFADFKMIEILVVPLDGHC